MEEVGSERNLGGSSRSVPQVTSQEDNSERNLGGSQASVPQVPDQEAEDYVRQISPDIQVEESNQEAHEIEQDDDEEDDSRVLNFLKVLSIINIPCQRRKT